MSWFTDPARQPAARRTTAQRNRRTGGSDATAAGHDAGGALAQAAEDRSARGREDLTQTVAAITSTDGPPARPTACQPRGCRIAIALRDHHQRKADDNKARSVSAAARSAYSAQPRQTWHSVPCLGPQFPSSRW